MRCLKMWLIQLECVTLQWIVTTACTDTDCTGVNRYEPSPTLQLSSIPFDLGYLTGNVSGSIGFEEVLFGPFVIFSQVLGEQNHEIVHTTPR